MKIHVVNSGESVYLIAKKYNVSLQKIISDNELTNPEHLVIGQTLVIMDDTAAHRIKAGESLYTISRQYQISLNSLISANTQISNPDLLTIGQTITIPSGSSSFGTISVNGYTFPNVNKEVLRKTLPNLTYLAIFSYQVNSDGSLNTIPDEQIIQAARAARVAPPYGNYQYPKRGQF